MKHAFLYLILCSFSTLLLGIEGYGVSAPGSLDTQSPSLSLIAPNGDEIWHCGDIENILWYAGDSNLDNMSVYLWLSLDSGENYSSIAQGISNTLSYEWQIPQICSNSAKVRIRVHDTFGNQSVRTSAGNFSILSSQMSAPEELTLEIVNGTDVLLSWQPVTQMTDGTPATPDAYRIFACTSPSIDDLLLNLLGTATGLTFTHYGASQTNDRLFYTVIAYADDNDSIGKGLKEQIKSRPKNSRLDFPVCGD